MKLYTINQVVKMRIDGIKSQQTISKLIANGKIKIIDNTTGNYKRYLIPESEINKFIK